ncbi:hypothetical protein [Burkholderia sp. WSM2230]|uniref:hypothetical protein n=1 Tax=Burkholderia sp. WSM2230 TaxID=944435 RepID=UPI00040F175D|nr:hypothetical protein [Burkholderia sp. WSM2230]
MNRFNRQLHADEKQVIKNLANGDADKEHRMEAAGCALVHCAARCAFGACLGANHSIGGSTAFEFGVGLGGFTKTPNIDGNAVFGY